MVVFRGLTFYKNQADGSATGLTTEGNHLVLNGAPLRILSGAVHYFRVIPEYWRERLLQLKACGLNTVETYVAWNRHEPLPGVFDFEGILDVRRFIKLAQELDLMVIFRPGPYICAEWEFGGLPSWLLHDPDMRVRTTYPPYMQAVERFLAHLLPLVSDLQFTKGGPVILVQVENEYGAYGSDRAYMDAHTVLTRKYGIVEALVTSDGEADLEAGFATDVWITVNEQVNFEKRLSTLRNLRPNHALMVMEFWTGWFDHWNESQHTVPVEQYARELGAILTAGASVNLFMFHGGTNWGFMNGANHMLSSPLPYEPTITSYDYDSPVSESGRLTEKYHRTRAVLETHGLLASDLPDAPSERQTQAYGVKKVSGWMALETILEEMPKIQSEDVKPMEMLEYNAGYGQSYGWILYEKEIDNVDGSLILSEMHDRAIILTDGEERSIIEYVAAKNDEVRIQHVDSGRPTMTLSILVENMGRINFIRHPKTLDSQRKGLIGTVTFNQVLLKNWTIRPLEFTTGQVQSLAARPGWKAEAFTSLCPALFRLQLDVTDNETCDTFLDMSGWGRGVVLLNGHNVGRYWPSAGPQRTLYVPGPLLKKGANTVVIFELHQASDTVEFRNEHLLA